MSFERWNRLSPVVGLAKQLGIEAQLTDSKNWDDFQSRVASADGDNSQLIKTAKKLALKASTGEVSVLAAIMYAADFPDVADQIAGNGSWMRFRRTRGDYSEAVALPIMRA